MKYLVLGCHGDNMNKFNEKVEKLKLEVSEREAEYYRLKAVYGDNQDKLTQKEHTLRSLQSKFLLDRVFLQKRVHALCECHEKQEQTEGRVAQLSERVKQLQREIAEVEENYDSLMVEYLAVRDELREIHQALQ